MSDIGTVAGFSGILPNLVKREKEHEISENDFKKILAKEIKKVSNTKEVYNESRYSSNHRERGEYEEGKGENVDILI